MSAIRVELELADGQFVTRMLHAGETVERFNENLKKAYPQLKKIEDAANEAKVAVSRFADGTMVGFHSMTKVTAQARGFISTLRDLTIILGLAHSAITNIQSATTGWGADIIRTSAEMERMNMLMRSMSNAADPIQDAANTVNYLREMAQRTPFTLSTLADSFAKIKSTGTDPLDISMKALTNSVAAFGGTDDIFKRATLAVSQMSGKGVIQMEELRQQLGEAIPRATELMARGMGVSYGELVKAIATGTVKSKEALNAMYLELERTFGGAAQRMMTTFSGQLQRMQGLYQSLQLVAGDTGFFEVMKQQLRDLNNFLDSKSGEDFAKAIGGGLRDLVGYVRAAVDWVVKFRSEIVFLGKALVLAWGSGLVIRGFASFVGAVGGARTAIRQLNGDIKGFTAKLMAAEAAKASSAMGAMMGVAMNASVSMSWLNTVINWLPVSANFANKAIFGLKVGIYGLATALNVVAPWLPLIGVAVAATASYFDLFGEKAESAADKLRNFTSATLEELNAAKKIQEEEAKRLGQEADAFEKWNKSREKYIAARRKVATDLGVDQEAADEEAYVAGLRWDKEVTEKRDQQIKIRREMALAETKFEETNSAEQVRLRMDAVNTRLGVLQFEYDQQGRALEKTYVAQRERLMKAGEDTTAIEQQYQKTRAARASDFYAAMIKKTQDLILAEQLAMRATGAGAAEQIAVNKRVIQELTAQQIEYYRQREAALKEGMGIDVLPKETNSASLMAKAVELLNRLKASGEEYKAEMAGAHGETAKLVYMLREAEKFGGPDTVGMNEMINSIIQAQDEVETLQDLLKGQNDLERDAAAVNAKLEQDLFEARTGNLSDLDKLIIKIKEGYYEGQGPRYSPLEKSIENAKTNVLKAASNVDLLKEAFGRTFGGETITMMDTFISKIGSMNEMFGAMRMTIDSIGGGTMGYPGGTQVENPFQQKTLESNAWGTGPRSGLKGNTLNTGNPGADAAMGPIPKTSGVGSFAADNPASKWKTSDLPSPENISLNATLSIFEAQWRQKRLVGIQIDNKRIETERELTNQIKRRKDQVEGLGTAETKLRESIANGEEGPDLNPDAEVYKKRLELARELDAAEITYDEKKKARRRADNQADAVAASKTEIAARRVEALARMGDPLEQKSSAALRTYIRKLDEYVLAVGEATGKTGRIYQAALEQRMRAENDFRAAEDLEYGADLAQKNIELRQSLMTANQSRSQALNLEIEQERTRLAAFRGTTQERLALEEQVLERIRLLREDYAASSPIGRMRQEWMDSTEAMQQATVSWLSSATDQLAQFATTGKLDFKSLADSIIQDIIRITLRAMIARTLGVALGGSATAPGPGLGGFVQQAFDTGHTGGVVGSLTGRTHVSPAVFHGAARYHSGNIVKKMGLKPSEVPIIAKEGEGVFTKEQMRAMGDVGGKSVVQNVTISPNINVNATGGTEAQNKDLGDQISKSIVPMIKSMVVSEIMQQRRPGNMLR
jgi:lambda family phage tail tape measure protein